MKDKGLERLIRRHNMGQQVALRGRIVLAAGSGQNNSRIAREMNVNLETVRLWRQRWLDLQPISMEDLSIEERLEDLPRPGAPAQFTADQICKFIKLAYEKPEEKGRLMNQWTSREIADEVIKRGVVEKISARHVVRLLKKRVTLSLIKSIKG